MAANQDSSVSSRITLFNQQAEEHQNWMMINPFAHYNVSEMPKRTFPQEEYGKAPAGSLSERRSLEANVRALEEILQLCDMIEKSGQDDPESGLKTLAFGPLFSLYNDISDKLLATLLCARKHGFVGFSGETLFQGRDEAVPVHLLRPFEKLKTEILAKVADLRCVFTEKLEEPAALRQD
ncbi:actin-binding Rho-activating protein isoform X1 [Drosophila elegans]|uniref:actin-binding Rho-activating protein isoform X1 n=2 Tax=Drosophila elegans TaxID=30023 RepID=UPI0007E60250|nr:actin-binding Rho-activating protein isoform X1 [Drosophila elegans]